MDPILLLMQMASTGLNAVGSYYDAKTQKYGLLSAAQNAEFQAGISSLNARNAEVDAQATLEAGQAAVGMRSMQGAQERAGAKVADAASGVQAGVGSAAEVQASMRLAEQIDAGVISKNAVRQAWGRRAEAADAQNQANLAMTEAAHLRRTAKKINPYLSAASTLMGGASQVASRWVPQTYPDYDNMPQSRRR